MNRVRVITYAHLALKLGARCRWVARSSYGKRSMLQR
ncbi:hypothetical protein SAMN05414139_02028 [Burkholderia sp. D7]|nr:hypothetical protein SAMN05414139_02028 [Burkholderia sp. D7]